MAQETAKKLTKAQQAELEKEEAREMLRELLDKSGRKIYTVLKHVSSSGMSRRISCLIDHPENGIMNIDYWIHRLGKFKESDKGGLKVNGCGMDMGFHVVYSTSYDVYKDVVSERAGYVVDHRWL